MTFRVAPGHAARRLSLIGELDVAETDALAQAVAEAIDGPGDLTFDLRGLEFIDSSGVRALVEVAGSLQGGSLILEAPTAPVQRVFDLVGIEGGAAALVVVPASD